MPLKFRNWIKRIWLLKRSCVLGFLSFWTFFLKRRTLDRPGIKNVLILAQHRLGDTVVSIPALQAVRNSLPQSRIFVFSSQYIRDILERIDSVADIISFGEGLSLGKKVDLIRSQIRSPIDLTLDLTCDYTMENALLAFLTGARYRVGYNTFGRGFLFDTALPPQKAPVHITDEILAIVQSIGLKADDKSLHLTASDQAKEKTRVHLEEQGISKEEIYIVIHPGGHYPTQRWPTESFARLADKLIQKYRIKIVLAGGPREEILVRKISENMTREPVLFLEQPVRNLMALIQDCRILICNNSGPLHLAVALGIPTVSTMGPTLPERWWPLGSIHRVVRKELPCMPCNQGVCRIKTSDCMKHITVEEMLEAVDEQIQQAAEKKERKNG